jgi:hypothetical protein
MGMTQKRQCHVRESRFRGLTRDGIIRAVERKSISRQIPCWVELIPCSVAQGIHFREPRKLLNSQMFLGRIFAGSGQNRENSLLFPCMAGNRTLDDYRLVVSQGWIPAFAGMTQGQRTSF